MSKLSLKVLLGVFALMFSASVGLSANNTVKFIDPHILNEITKGENHNQCIGAKDNKYIKPQLDRCQDLILCDIISWKRQYRRYKRQKISKFSVAEAEGKWTSSAILRKDFCGQYSSCQIYKADKWIKEAERRGLTPQSCLSLIKKNYLAAGGRIEGSQKKVSVSSSNAATAPKKNKYDVDHLRVSTPYTAFSDEQNKLCFWMVVDGKTQLNVRKCSDAALCWHLLDNVGGPETHWGGDRILQWRDEFIRYFSDRLELERSRKLRSTAKWQDEANRRNLKPRDCIDHLSEITEVELIDSKAVKAKNLSASSSSNNTKIKTNYDFAKSYRNQSETRRKQIQYALKKLGYYSKKVDGVWGGGTKNALQNYASSNELVGQSPESVFYKIVNRVNVPKSFASKKPSKSKKKAKNSGETNLLKLLLLGGICASTPDPSACLAGAAGSASRSKKPDYSSIDDGYDDNSSSSTASCSSDFQCGFREKCVKRLGKSMCVKVVDSNERKVRDRNAEPMECRYDSQCPSGFECDKQFRICVVD